MTAFLVVSLLAFAALHNESNDGRMTSCIAVLWVTIASYVVYHAGPYNTLVESIGYYQYQAVIPLLSILILYFIRCKLAICLMLVYLIQILFGLSYFVFEGQGWYIYQQYQLTMWLLFGVQMALMFSARLTDNVYGGICRAKLAGVSAKAFIAPKHRADSAKRHSSENQA